MAEHTELERDLRTLETTLRRLETEYTMFFAGQLPRPPLETRARVEALLKRYDRAYIQSYADRFRLNTLQARFAAFIQLWDRGLRAREEGRPGPYVKSRDGATPPPLPPAPAETGEAGVGDAPLPAAAAPAGSGAVVRAAAPARPVSANVTVVDPAQEAEKLQALYKALVEARRQTGNDESLPFQRFAQMVSTQVSRLRDAGSREVAFRVAVKDGKVSLTARGIKGAGGAGGGGGEGQGGEG